MLFVVNQAGFRLDLRPHRGHGWPMVAILLTSFALVWDGLGGEPSPPPASAERLPEPVEFPGQLICLPEFYHHHYGTELLANHEHVVGFRSREERIFTLLRTKFSEALFLDPQLGQRELLLKARLFPGSQILEVTRIRSIHAGVVHDLFYYCTVCSIESVSAGPCPCCQGTVELRETPARPSGQAP